MTTRLTTHMHALPECRQHQGAERARVRLRSECRVPARTRPASRPAGHRDPRSPTRSRRTVALAPDQRYRSCPPAIVRTQSLTPADVMEVAGVPTVVPALAAVSAAVSVHPDWMVAIMDSAAWGAPEQLHRWRSTQRPAAPRWHRRGASGRALVRSGAQTPLESLSRAAADAVSACPSRRLQVPFYDDEGLIGIVDMYLGRAGRHRRGGRTAQVPHRRRPDRREVPRGPLRRVKPVVRWDWTQMRNAPDSSRSGLAAAGSRRTA